MKARSAIVAIAAGYLIWLVGSLFEASNFGRLISWFGFIGFALGFLILLVKIFQYPGFKDFLDS